MDSLKSQTSTATPAEPGVFLKLDNWLDTCVGRRKPGQVTLGSLVLTCKDPAPTMACLTLEAFQELKQVIDETESTLAGLFAYDQLNYLVLMMVDPQVHFHVIPRYGSQRTFGGMAFQDPSWPKPPDTLLIHETSDDLLEQLRDHVRRHWKPGMNRMDGNVAGAEAGTVKATFAPASHAGRP